MDFIKGQRGFTLQELVVVIMLVGIISTVAMVQFQDFREDARDAITRDELAKLKTAIVGDGRVVSSGNYVFPGYEADNSDTPDSIGDLTINPSTGDQTQDYNPLTGLGWRGPYIDDSTLSDATKDAWGENYVYEKANRKIRSKGPDKADDSGGGDDIEIDF